MAMKTICEAFPVADPKADYAAAAKVGRYRFGGEAVYFPGFPSTQYLPVAALSRAWVQKSAIAAKGCCGAQLPVYLLRVQYQGEFYQNFTFDKPAEADRALKLLAERRPDLPLEPEKKG